MKKEETKHTEYAVLIAKKISELFDENDPDSINMDHLLEGENLTHFIHAMASVAPSVIYEGILGKPMDCLEFNHLANRLCFQYMKIVD